MSETKVVTGIAIKNVRLSFPALFEPKVMVGGEGDPRYSAAFAIDPASANAKAIEAEIKRVADVKWTDKAAAILKELKAKARVAYKTEPMSKDGQVYGGFEGMHTLNASSKTRPTVVDRDKTPLTARDGRIYGGCYVNVLVEFWAQDNQFGKRINCTLRGVQFVKDGEAFGGGMPASADDFDDLTGDEDDLV